MTPPNYTLAPDRRWSTISHATARAWATDHRPNLLAKSSRDGRGARVTFPQPHPAPAVLSPKPWQPTAAIIADPVKSP
jgi:hypothetical protein